MLHNLMVLFTSWLYSQVPSLFEQMQAEAEDSHCHSEDDFDEDEATQYIIEQSLIQYRKLKRLSPRSELNIYIYKLQCKTLLFDLRHYYDVNSDLKPNKDPDEIFKAIKEGKLMQPYKVLQVIIHNAK